VPPSTGSRPRVERCAVITHGDAGRTRSALDTVVDVLGAAGVELLLPEDECEKHPAVARRCSRWNELPQAVDLGLVLGGDGTTLRALHRFMVEATPVIGVNFGRVGFLTSIGADELVDRLPAVLAGGYDVVALPTITSRVGDARHVAVNDVLVTSGVQGRMAVLEWTVNGIPMGERGCDGIVVATPSGSTAYNLSAGGPVLGWGVDAMVATFVAPHALDARPLVLSHGHRIEVVSRSRGFTSRLVVDGHLVGALDEGGAVEIAMGPDQALLATLPDRPFLARFRDTFSR
jgi:NAD+ kinase